MANKSAHVLVLAVVSLVALGMIAVFALPIGVGLVAILLDR